MDEVTSARTMARADRHTFKDCIDASRTRPKRGMNKETRAKIPSER
jgi:hypothetical protein